MPAPVVAAPVVPAAVEAQAPVAAAAPAASAEPADRTENSGAEAGLLALLAAIGLAGAGLLLMRSRRRSGIADEDLLVMPEPAAAPIIPVAAAPMVPDYTMYGATEAQPSRASAAPSPTGDAAIPDGPIPRGEERDALLRRIVAAEPDEANPFRSRKARLRRARLTLQRLEHEREIGQQDTDFDWRTYRPSAAANPAERVDA